MLKLWQEALKEKIGICINTNDRKLMQQQLYRVRAEANDPELDKLTIVLPENEDELWLVHKDAQGSIGANNKGNLKLVL